MRKRSQWKRYTSSLLVASRYHDCFFATRPRRELDRTSVFELIVRRALPSVLTFLNKNERKQAGCHRAQQQRSGVSTKATVYPRMSKKGDGSCSSSRSLGAILCLPRICFLVDRKGCILKQLQLHVLTLADRCVLKSANTTSFTYPRPLLLLKSVVTALQIPNRHLREFHVHIFSRHT